MSPCERFSVKPSAWGLALEGPLSGEENMRRDWEAFEAQQDPRSVPAVRLYRWGEPTVSYGRLQSREAAEAFASGFGARVVQRPTGGGMVFHQSDLSFSIVWRRDHPALPPCIKNVYRLFHEAIANEFRSLGMEVSLHQTEGPRRTFPGACYQEFSQDDILWNGQKLVGGALRVTSWGRLYQGNLKILPSLASYQWTDRLVNAFAAGVFHQTFSLEKG
jgi:lipoate-protein ligase A